MGTRIYSLWVRNTEGLCLVCEGEGLVLGPSFTLWSELNPMATCLVGEENLLAPGSSGCC
jgi:hypothetical protein